MDKTAEIVTALRTLSQVTLSIQQFATLMAAEEITEEMVERELNLTDQTINELRESD